MVVEYVAVAEVAEGGGKEKQGKRKGPLGKLWNEKLQQPHKVLGQPEMVASTTGGWPKQISS